uniref:NCLDV major capsid protein n=1 Tax=viral metagenome TaxID=1070528 RepID=A0A6C0BFH9_9ZZZZ
MSGGGLINIVSNSTSDIFLTGDPQITFYKMSYRRYTNFSIDTIDLPFNNSISFGNETELIVNRFGDLISKTGLHITIPSIEITKKDVGIDITNLRPIDNPLYLKNYNDIKNIYMNIMSNIYKIVYKGYQSINVSYLSIRQDVKNYVNSYYTTNNKKIIKLLDEYNELLTNYKLDYRLSNLWYIITHINYDRLVDNVIIKEVMLKELQYGIEKCREVQTYFFNSYQNFKKQKEQFYDNNIKSAWTKKLGHSMIDYIDIFIGGKRIDRHLGIWIDIWNDLVYKETQIDSYNNLIGNIDVLTNFNIIKKPSYDIYVPMSFWFNKYYGLAFPLIAMQYNDIHINVKLRKFEEVFYTEKIYKCYVNDLPKNLTASMIDFIRKESKFTITDIEETNIYLQDIWENNNYSLSGNIITDYIFLDNNERKRFAQSGHEYLIETNQNSITENVSTNDFDIVFDQFKNQCKEIVWATTQNCLTTNTNGSTECQWYNYSNRGKNPITTTQLNLNGHVRLQKQNSNYYNNYQPYVYHKRSIPKGINMYSFCLEPLQHQPSGACNFTVIDDIRMFLTIDNTYYRYINKQLYPHDLHINFDIIINNPNELLEKMDYEFSLFTINKYTNENVTYDTDTKTIKEMLFHSEKTIKVYNMLKQGINLIELNDYRQIYLKTDATFYAFNSALNILRLIGGYGSLAYSGNV